MKNGKSKQDPAVSYKRGFRPVADAGADFLQAHWAPNVSPDHMEAFLGHEAGMPHVTAQILQPIKG